MDFNNISLCKIYPGIGVARLGNSPNGFFVGPEAPGQPADIPGGFKDLQGRIKRQASRFRVYAYSAAGDVLGELVSDDNVLITWRVALANTKAEWYEFHGVKKGMLADQGTPDPVTHRRNRSTENRTKLKITPRERTISGNNSVGEPYRFDDGMFFDLSVFLGELRTDDQGRLIVLGGFGVSGKTSEGKPITNYANNDFWHDDISDGPVNATVTIRGTNIPTVGAWVTVAPPKFVPGLKNVVTLYDVINATLGLDAPPQRISFAQHVFPLLNRISGYQWVTTLALRGHGPSRGGDFLNPDLISHLADNSSDAEPYRRRVFERIRDPRKRLAEQANYSFMPPLSGDEGTIIQGEPDKWLYLLESQYSMLERWAKGNFDSDWAPPLRPARPLQEFDLTLQPHALDEAALENCVGGAFYPGIEMTYIARYKEMFDEPYRVKPSTHQAGDLTKRMACPWQADFYECNTNWWPIARPDDVINRETYEQLLRDMRDERVHFVPALMERVSWARGVGKDIRYFEEDGQAEQEKAPPHGDNGMVSEWSSLGFVTAARTPKGELVYIEDGRSRYDGLSDREYFYIMMNLDSFPDFTQKAKQLADSFLEKSQMAMSLPAKEGGVDEIYRPFPYSPEALNSRLDEIYESYRELAEKPFDPEKSFFKTRDDVIERVVQLAPFNQTDGGWLRNISSAGPIDEVNSLLFSIWMDEAGEGTPEKNHANLYTQLLKDVGVNLPAVNTLAYAQHPRFLDSAFTAPVFELVISQFTRTFLPEILGMTLQLEWEVLSLWSTINMFRYPTFNLDPHFYVMHVGIDNASDGHGARAKRAVQLYLDHIRAKTGSEDEVQRQWQRIWNGYVAFYSTGTVAQDLNTMLRDRRKHPASTDDKLIALIAQKKEFGQLNHNMKKLGPNLINDWFDDPKGFLDALRTHGYVVPGAPDESRLLKLFSFNGPMYKVFNVDEVLLWRDWISELLPSTPGVPVQTDPAKLMAKVIDMLKSIASGVEAHENVTLLGADPRNPEKKISQPLTWWLTQAPPFLMAALAAPENNLIAFKESRNSLFYMAFVNGQNRMGDIFRSTLVPDSGGLFAADVVRNWIDSGCPIPKEADRVRSLVERAPAEIGRTRRVLYTDAPEDISAHSRGTVLGMGSVH